MPYYLTGDEFADDPAWEAMAAAECDRDGEPLPRGPRLTVDALQASHQRLMAKSSHLKTDGYLTSGTVERYASSRRVLVALTLPVLGRPPKLHRQGDDCECLGDQWIDGFAYRLHRFLRRNPSKKEYDRSRAQRRDLEDSRLRAQVYERDGGCCRYCHTGPLNKKSNRFRDRRKVLHFDHVDPDAPAGPDAANMVVACARCNEHKGARLPHEADMVLRPIPTDAQRAEWAQRGLNVFDLGPDQPADHPPINPGTTADQPAGVDPPVDPLVDPGADPPVPTIDEQRLQTMPQLGPKTADHQADQPGQPVAEGLGRVGEPRLPGRGVPARGRDSPGQPARTPLYPDIYHRRSRGPAHPPSPPVDPPPEGSPP